MHTFVRSYRDTRIAKEADTWQVISMFGWSPKQAVQETEPAQEGQLVNITNKVPQMMEGSEIVTGKYRKKRERQAWAEDGSFKQQTSLTDLQQFVEIDQNDREEPPRFDPVQESSAEPPKMSPSARRLLPPSDSDPNPPPVRGSYVG